MKIIDKTPLQDEKGNISFTARIQGSLKYGLSWYAELEAQKAVIEQLDRLLEKGFILIRNFTLPGSDIVIPIILVGTGGMWVIYVTKEKGHFEARGDQWNTVDSNGKSLPASINYIDRASKLATVFQRYLKIQKFELSQPVEPVLIAADPGAQIESVRPILRVVRSDAIKQFASSLLQAPPIWRSDFVRDAAERIVNPRPPRELEPVYPEPVPPQAAPNTMAQAEDYGNAFQADELGFAFEEPAQLESAPQQQPSVDSTPAQRQPQQRPPVKRAPVKKKFLGLGTLQVIVLMVLAVIACCIVLGLGYYIYLNYNLL